MHFDQREQRALRDVGLSTDDIQDASDAVVEATDEAAAQLESFFEGRDVVYSDVDLAHSGDDVVEHDLEYVDLFTHADEIRGYVRFASWGVPVEGGRVLTDEKVELRLGPTVHDRVRFATDPEEL